MNSQIADVIEHTFGRDDIKLKFLNRLESGNLTREENPTSHFCSYFPAYDPNTHHIFLGLHKRSGLWLANGGHIHIGELPFDTVLREAKEEWGITLDRHTTPNPQLLTLTEIEHPERQICEWHYDFWYFLPFDKSEFHPDPILLASEFIDYGWKSYENAEHLFSDPSSFEALTYLKNLI